VLHNLEKIQKNLLKVKADITAAEKKYHRLPGSVVLVAVSKTQPHKNIKAAQTLGQIHFGESYLQEALPKIAALAAISPNIIWHYIGRIQSKKTKLLALNFAWVETVTDFATAELLNKYRPLSAPSLNICIQVNVDNSQSKSGVRIDDILPLAKKITLLPKLNLRGLMTIPNHQEKFEQQLAIFHTLFLEFKKLQQHGISVDTLSMGMSNDFTAAIAAGATMVRVGRTIFGARP
jgi:hypothetical protein